MGHNKYIISLKYWESKLLECYLLSLTVSQKGHPAMFPIYIIYSLFHICSRAATSGNPPRCPVVHSSSPSTCQTHFYDAKSLYSFFSSSAQIYFPFFSPPFSLLSRANLNSMENTHTHIQGWEISRACHFTFTFEPFSWRSHPGWLTETVQRQGWTRMVRRRWKQESRRRRRQVYMYLLQFGELVWWPSDPWNPSFKNLNFRWVW